MAARKRKVELTDAWKKKIQVSMLGLRLYDHALGNIEMSATQIKAADILLRKLVPDLSRAEHTGEGGGPVALSMAVKFVAANG